MSIKIFPTLVCILFKYNNIVCNVSFLKYYVCFVVLLYNVMLGCGMFC